MLVLEMERNGGFGEKANSSASLFLFPSMLRLWLILDLFLFSGDNVLGFCQLHCWGKSGRPRPSACLDPAWPVGVEVTALVSDGFLAC